MITPNADELLANNRHWADDFADGSRPVAPRRKLAIVTCMDSRMDIFAILGLENGEAHIVRNAGGVVTDDVIRSLCVSQRSLGTEEIMLIHHTDCGLQLVSEDDFKATIQTEVGLKPEWSLESFVDPFRDVEQSMLRLQISPFVKYKDDIRGFVYDVATGLLNEVHVPADA